MIGDHLRQRHADAVLDGMLLIFLRPYPTEVGDLAEMLSGLDLVADGHGTLAWLRLRGRKTALISPFMISLFTSLLLLAFFLPTRTTWA